MKIIVAPDTFEGSLTAVAAAQAMGRGAVFALPPDIPLTLVELPLSNGGRGLVDCLTAATYGRKIVTTVVGPMGDPVEAEWGLLGDGSTAVVEAAAASGLHLIPQGMHKPLRAHTFGTGQLIAAALDRGVRRLIVGTGDVASIDGGAGMAQALGIHLRDAQGYEVGRGGRLLKHIAHIDGEKRHQRIPRTEIIVAADTWYPLCGPGGTVAVCAPQFGLSLTDKNEAETGLDHLAERLRSDLNANVALIPGSGAGGGLAAGMVGFLGAQLCCGIDLVLRTVRFPDHLRDAALVLTGQGQIDRPLQSGSVIMGVARAAGEAGIPCMALVASPGADIDELRSQGITAVHSLPQGNLTDGQADAADRLEEWTQQVVSKFVADRIAQ